MKLGACQSSSVNRVTLCRKRIAYDLRITTHKLLNNLVFLAPYKKESWRRILLLHQTSVVYILEMYDLSFMLATLLFIKMSVDSTPSQVFVET